LALTRPAAAGLLANGGLAQPRLPGDRNRELARGSRNDVALLRGMRSSPSSIGTLLTSCWPTRSRFESKLAFDHWKEHCPEYQDCGLPVYFTRRTAKPPNACARAQASRTATRWHRSQRREPRHDERRRRLRGGRSGLGAGPPLERPRSLDARQHFRNNAVTRYASPVIAAQLAAAQRAWPCWD
jgi:hypothetical protein